MKLQTIALARLKAALADAGAPPRRRHGQHFLQDHNLLDAIVRDAGVASQDVVIEIGPGPGLLTRHLLATGARVLAFEIDARARLVADALIEPELLERLSWIEGDVLDGSKRMADALSTRLAEATAVVSNLPYNVSGPIIANVLSHADCPPRLVVMVQREMAQRLLAREATEGYGPLAVLTALCADGKTLRSVPAAAFWPPPRVDSALIRLDRRADRPDPTDLARLSGFLAGAFHGRRKTLLNSLSAAFGGTPAELSRTLGLAKNLEKLRAEAFSPIQLFALAQTWASHASSGRNRS